MGKKKESSNIFKVLFDDIVKLKRKNMGEVPEAILNTMDFIFQNDDIKPVLIKNGVKKYSGGWHFIFKLNPGCTFKKVFEKRDYLDSVVFGTVDIKFKDTLLHIDVTDFKFEKEYGFDLLTPTLFKKHRGMYLPLPIGVKTGGKFLIVDMEETSHILTGGINNSGKSSWFRQCMLFLAKYRPDIRQILIDYKRVDAKPMRKIAIVGTSTDEAHFILDKVCMEVDRRLTLLEDNDCFKTSEIGLSPVVVFIDELAEMEDKGSQKMLNHLARLGRAAGVYLIISLQRPSHTTYKNFTDSRSQFGARMCFRMGEKIDSEIVLGKGNYKAYDIDAKGRAVWQGEKEMEVQSVFVDSKDVKYYLNQMEVNPEDDIISPQTWLLP